jgi:hypothetical protein
MLYYQTFVHKKDRGLTLVYRPALGARDADAGSARTLRPKPRKADGCGTREYSLAPAKEAL